MVKHLHMQAKPLLVKPAQQTFVKKFREWFCHYMPVLNTMHRRTPVSTYSVSAVHCGSQKIKEISVL
jgi:hypothetical protein